MFVPKTAIYKDDGFIFRQNNIRFSWKRSDILSVSEAMREQDFSDSILWLRVGASDVRHISASHFLGVIISHINPLLRHNIQRLAGALYSVPITVFRPILLFR